MENKVNVEMLALMVFYSAFSFEASSGFPHLTDALTTAPPLGEEGNSSLHNNPGAPQPTRQITKADEQVTADVLQTTTLAQATTVQSGPYRSPTSLLTSSVSDHTTTPDPTCIKPPSGAPGTTPSPIKGYADIPSELNVGDDDLVMIHNRPPLDPVLAGLLSVFVMATAIIFLFLFLKFRQHSRRPEFHRLQDLPMDDMMEDTPLSRYSY